MIASGGIWIVFVVILAFIPLLPKAIPPREFPSIRITLNPPAPAEMPLAAAQPAKNAAQPDVPAKSAGKTAAPKASSSAAKAVSRTAPAKSSPAGLGIPNFSSPLPSSRETDGSAEELDFTSQTQTARPKSVNSGVPVPELEGNAAQISKSEGATAAVSGKSSGTGTPSKGGAASAATSDALGTIAKQAQSGSASGGKVAPGTAGDAADGKPKNTVSSISGLDFDGSPRTLRAPKKPEITLPANLAKDVTSDTTVTVEFIVMPDGSVPRGPITFNPSALLSAAIQDYLKDQFSLWRFEPGMQDGQARFRYSIKVK